MTFTIRQEKTQKHYICVDYCPFTGVYTTSLCRLVGAEYIDEKSGNYSNKKSALSCFYRYRREAKNEEI